MVVITDTVMTEDKNLNVTPPEYANSAQPHIPLRKPAATEAELHELIRDRWSPRAFSDQAVPAPAIRSFLEAARWAPSSMNAQPWSFIVAGRVSEPEAHERVLATLAPANAAWARRAPLLVIAVARLNHANGAPNRHALYDTGQAVAQLTMQATADGLSVHQMGGFSVAAATERFRIPDGYEPVAVLAIGYRDDPGVLAPELRERELAPRSRKPLREFVHAGEWNRPLDEGAPAFPIV